MRSQVNRSKEFFPALKQLPVVHLKIGVAAGATPGLAFTIVIFNAFLHSLIPLRAKLLGYLQPKSV